MFGADASAKTGVGLIHRFFLMNEVFRDLFGDVVVAKRCRGRPAHVPTAANRSKVARLLVAGCPKVEIAKAIGITLPTFRLHYLHSKNRKKIG